MTSSNFPQRRWIIFCVVSALSILFCLHIYLGNCHTATCSEGVFEQDLRSQEVARQHEPRDLSADATPPTAEPTTATVPTEVETPSSPSDTSIHSKTLVIARTSCEDTDWVAAELSSEPQLSTAIYTMDDASPSNPIPQNKGHEAMAYLTHVIESYDQLSDVTIFMHAHRFAWHNNDLLDSDAVKMVQHLSIPHVLRNGYVNLRCHHNPGCPAHIFPNRAVEDIHIPEAVIMHDAWTELFPNETVPEVLAQPCCAQVAVSRERIQALPLERYIQFRNWLLETPLDDSLSGRVFEYVWQYIWGGTYEYCPDENICYCETYGLCFGGEAEYDHFFDLKEGAVQLYRKVHGGSSEQIGLQDRNTLVSQMGLIDLRLRDLKEQAFERGKDLRNRAFEAGR